MFVSASATAASVTSTSCEPAQRLPERSEAVRAGGFSPPNSARPRHMDSRAVVTEAVESTVLVACVFRPPTLNTPTVGETKKNVGTAADDVAFPLRTVTPLYPPLAVGDGTVLVQVTVGVDGNVVAATVVRSAPVFDESALSAERRWTFRPARIHGRCEKRSRISCSRSGSQSRPFSALNWKAIAPP